MAIDEGLLAWIEESIAPLGVLTRRAMMGGATLYLDGVIFAILASTGGLWFKSDAQSDAEWDAAGCERFTLAFADGSSGSMNYRRAPDGVYDDAGELRRWASLALAAGQRAPKKAKAVPRQRKPRAGSSPRRS